MYKRLYSLLTLLSITGLGFLSSCDKDDNITPLPPVVKPDIVFYGLSNSNRLISFNANASQTAIATTTITGFQVAKV